MKKCPKCGSENVSSRMCADTYETYHKCDDCGNIFNYCCDDEEMKKE